MQCIFHKWEHVGHLNAGGHGYADLYRCRRCPKERLLKPEERLLARIGRHELVYWSMRDVTHLLDRKERTCE